MRELIPEALDGERLDRLVAMVADVSRKAAATAIDEGRVTVDGAAQSKGSARIHEGQVLEIVGGFDPPIVSVDPDPSVAVTTLHVDDDVIIVDKAVGSVVHPGAGHDTGTLIQGLLAQYPEIAEVGQPGRPGVVHRLDKGTSGVLMVARSTRAYDSLTDQLRERTVSRRYLTIAWGHPESSDGIIDAPVGRAVRDPTRMTVREDGKTARTRYHQEASWHTPKVTLFSCTLETGRTHQIRVHMEAIGHPVVGDGRYGGGRTGVDLDRPALHAAELGFSHPATGEWNEFTSALPEDMATVLRELGPPEVGTFST